MNTFFQEFLNNTDLQAIKQDKQIFIYPNIPPRKIAGAMSYLPAHIRSDEILAVVDDTVFGSCTDGITLTCDAIYCK
jgi:hypothetical protein